MVVVVVITTTTNNNDDHYEASDNTSAAAILTTSGAIVVSSDLQRESHRMERTEAGPQLFVYLFNPIRHLCAGIRCVKGL